MCLMMIFCCTAESRHVFMHGQSCHNDANASVGCWWHVSCTQCRQSCSRQRLAQFWQHQHWARCFGTWLRNQQHPSCIGLWSFWLQGNCTRSVSGIPGFMGLWVTHTLFNPTNTGLCGPETCVWWVSFLTVGTCKWAIYFTYSQQTGNYWWKLTNSVVSVTYM